MRQGGYSLPEMLMGLGIIMAIVAGVAAMAVRTDSSRAQVEAEDAVALLDALVGSEGRMGYYTHARERAIADELAPDRMRVNGQLQSRWGPIEVDSFDVVETYDGHSRTLRNAGLRLTWKGVPARDCFEFARRLPRAERAVMVGGLKVASGGSFDGGAATRACQQGVDIVLEHWSGEAGEP